MFSCKSQKQRLENKNFRILIVEDSRVINNTLTSRLQEKGFNCLQSYDLATARDILQNNDITLVILDLHLPDGEGEDLIEEIKEANKATKIVIFTSENDLLRRDELFRLGILDYLLKGKNANLTVKEILNIIQSIQINPGYTLLIVDDSRVIRKMMQKILSSCGYTIIEAKNGAEAIEKVKETNVDLMLLDMQMPDMSGLDALKQIKQDEKNFHLPVFMISSTLDIEVMRDAYKAGVLDYFKKPFSPEELKLKVEQVIRQKQIETDLQCTLRVSEVCSTLLNEFYASAIFYADLKLKQTNEKFQNEFGKDISNMTQAFERFDIRLMEDIIMSMKNRKNYSTVIKDKENQTYLVKLLPVEQHEFLMIFEKLTKV
ncbi:response regulator [Sulfurimonas sediminis]|uniref:Response regulator n=1 Tax=Sulfurimonas sediminis TaxID=2590020 RepID=A0A7M1AYD2_9BACT|nr:response regulator [Sulfurimonas sediminis]QOP42463.1 response regulator [Sulfurimonas sediminis]